MDIIPVIHIGGSKEYQKHPGQVSPLSNEFLVKRTPAYLINIATNQGNYQRRHDTGGRRIFCDSGGLQTGTTGDFSLSPRQVMEWQNEHADIAFCLDSLGPFRNGMTAGSKLPLPELTANIIAAGTGPTFLRSAEETRRNINEAMKVKGEKVKLYCVVQGRSSEQLSTFHKIVTADHDLDGFGIKLDAGPSLSLQSLAWWWDNSNKPLHALGMGKIGRSYPLIYFASKYEKRAPITADSTTWVLAGAMFRRMYKSMGDLGYGTPEGVPAGPSRLACSCQVCDWGNQMLDLGGVRQDQHLFAHVLSAHNWQMMVDDHTYASVLSTKPALFREHAETFTRYQEETGTVLSDIIKATDVVDAIDMIHDGDGAKAVAKYCKRSMAAEAFF